MERIRTLSRPHGRPRVHSGKSGGEVPRAVLLGCPSGGQQIIQMMLP